MAAVDAHIFGGTGHVAVELGELVLDEFALVGVGTIKVATRVGSIPAREVPASRSSNFMGERSSSLGRSAQTS